MASEKHICQADKIVRTAVIFWLSNMMRKSDAWNKESMDLYILQDSATSMPLCKDDKPFEDGFSQIFTYYEHAFWDAFKCFQEIKYLEDKMEFYSWNKTFYFYFGLLLTILTKINWV